MGIIRRPSRGLAGVLACAAVVTGCADVPERPEARTLTVFLADDWAGTRPVTDAVRDFEAQHEGVRIRLQGLPFAQIVEAVRSTTDSGDTVDVAQWHPFAAAAQGLAQPIDDLWEGRLSDDEYVPGAVEDVEWRGRRYGVPLDTNALVLIRNDTALSEAGVDLASLDTWEGLRAAAEAVARGDRSAIALSNSSWRTYGWIRANGGDLFELEPDGSVRFTLDDPKVVEALDFLARLVTDGLAVGPSALQQSADAFALFQAGAAGLHASGTWDVASLEAQAPDWEYSVQLLPQASPDAGTVVGGSSLFVPVGSPNRELAFEFMLHLTSDRYALEMARSEGRVPARRRVLEDPFFDSPVYRTVVEALPTASQMRLIAFPEAADAFSTAVFDILAGRMPADEAMAEAQRRAEASVRR